MHTHIHIALLAHRHDRLEEILHVLTKLLLVDTLVKIQELTEFLHRSLIVLAEVATHETLCLDDDILHQLMILLGGHRLRQGISLGQHVTALAYPCRELKLCPFLTGTLTLQDIDIEVGKLSIVEIQVRGPVRILMKQVCTRPVEHRHKIIADAVDTLGREVTQTLLVHLYLMVTVRTAVLDGLHHRQTLHHAPAHAITLDIRTQLMDLLARPYLTQRHIVQRRHDTLHTNLSQHGKRNLILLAKPSPCSFHIILFCRKLVY